MSDDRVIDNKIVSLDFNCNDFKKKIKDTEKQIDSFNNKVDSIGSSKSKKSKFDELNDDANKLSKDGMSNIGKVAESVRLKFDAFGILGKRVLENIADTAFQAGKNLVKSLSVDQIVESWSKYEAEVSAVQLLVTSLSSYIGEGSGAKTEYTNEQIEDYSYEKLKKLKWFADETSYSYSAMTNALGGFIRSGYSDVDKSVTAIEGIATAAAQAGVSISQSEELFSVWSTVISGGTMMTRQFDQLNKTYKAFTGDFKTLLLESAAAEGTLKKTADGAYTTLKGTSVNIGNMRQALNEGYLTANVAMRALSDYGQVSNKLNEMFEKNGIRASEGIERLRKANAEATTDEQIEKLKKEGMYFSNIQLNAFEAAQACKTYGDAIDATKDAVSTQWAGIWKSLVGGYSEAKDLWTELCDYLWELFVPFVHYLNKAMEFWHALGGWDMLFSVDEDKYGAVWQLFDALLQVVDAIQKGFARVFPLFSTFDDEAEDFTSNAKKLAAYLKYYTSRFVSWVESILPTEEQLESISNFAEGIAALGKTIGNALIFAFKLIFNVASAVWTISEPIRYLFSYIVSMLNVFEDTDDSKAVSFSNVISNIANNIKNFLWPVVQNIVKFIEASKPIFEQLFMILPNVIKALGSVASPLITTGLKFVTGLFGNLGKILQSVNFAGIFENIGNALSGIMEAIGPALTGLGNLFGSIISNVSSFGKDLGITISDTVKNVSSTLESCVTTIIDTIWSIISTASKAIYSKLINVDWKQVVNAIQFLLQKMAPAIWLAIEGFLTFLASKAFTKAIMSFSGLMTRIAENLKGLGKTIDEFFSGLKKSIVGNFNKKQSTTTLKTIALALLELAAALWILSRLDIKELAVGLAAVILLTGIIIGSTAAFNKLFTGSVNGTNLKEGLKNMMNSQNILRSLKTVMTTLIISLIAISIVFVSVSSKMKSLGMSPGEMWSVAGILVVFMGALVGISYLMMRLLNGFGSVGGQQQSGLVVYDPSAINSNPTNTLNKSELGKKVLYLCATMLVMALAVDLVSAAFKEIADAVSDADFNQGEAWSIAGIIAVMITIVSVLSSLMMAFINAMVKSNSQLSGYNQKQFLADMGMLLATMFVVSVVVNMMTSSMDTIISSVSSNGFNQGEAWSVVGMLVVLMAAVGAMLYAITKMPYADWKKLFSFSGTMLILSLVTKILVSSFSDIAESFENLNPGYMWQSLGILVVIIGSIAGILMLISNFVNTVNVGKIFSMAAVLVIVSLAITILMSSVSVIGETFNTVNPGYMWQSVAILFVMAGVIGGLIAAFSQLIKNIKNVGGILVGALAFIAVSITINSLVTSLTSLAQAVNGIDIGAMWGVVGMMGAIIGVVMGLMILLGELAGKNAWILLGMVVAVAGLLVIGPCIQQMSDAFNTLMPSIVKIAAIDTASIWKAVAVISVLMFAFTLFGTTGVAAGIGLVQIAAGMYFIGKALTDGLIPALEKLASIEWESIGAAAGKLAVLGLALSAFALGGIIAIVLSAGIWILGLALSNGLIPAVQQLGEVDWEVIGSAAGKMAVLGLALAAFGIGASLAALPVLVIAGALGFLAIVATPFINAITGLIGACESFITAMSGIDKKAIPVILTLINTIPILFTAIATGCIAFIDTLGEGAQRSEKAIMKIITAICNAVTGSSHAITKAITTLTLDVIFMTLDAIEAVLPRLKDHIIFITDTILQYIIESIFSNTLTIIQSVWQGLIDIFNGVADLVEQKGNQLRVAFKRFIASVSKFAEKCLEDGDFLKEKMQPIFDLLGNVITDFIDPLATKLGELVSGAFTSFSLGLATGGVSAVISGAADKIVGLFSGSLKDGFEKADISTDIYSLKDYARSLTGNELQGFNTTVNKIAQIMGVSVDQVKAMNADSQDLQEGILKLEKALPTLGFSEHGEAIAQQFITGYKTRMRIKSPSKEMFLLGGFTMEGLINGIKEKAGELWNTIKEIGGNVLDIFRNALGLDKQDKDSQQGFDFLSLLGLGGDEKGESLEDKIRNSLGLGKNESGTDIIKNIFGENDFNFADWMGGDSFNLDDWIGKDIETDSKLFEGMDKALSAASNSAEASSAASNSAEASSSGNGDSKSKKKSSKTSNGRNGGQVYQNPQPGYTIIQNNYSPKALNSTEIYRRTKSTFAKLEGIKSV